MKIRPAGAELFHADGCPDGPDMTKLIVTFLNFANTLLKIPRSIKRFFVSVRSLHNSVLFPSYQKHMLKNWCHKVWRKQYFHNYQPSKKLPPKAILILKETFGQLEKERNVRHIHSHVYKILPLYTVLRQIKYLLRIL